MTHRKPSIKQTKKSSIKQTEKKTFYERFQQNLPELLNSMKYLLTGFAGLVAYKYAGKYASNILKRKSVKPLLKLTDNVIYVKFITDKLELKGNLLFEIDEMKTYLNTNIDSNIEIYDPYSKSTIKLSKNSIASLIDYLIPESIGEKDLYGAIFYLIDPEQRIFNKNIKDRIYDELLIHAKTKFKNSKDENFTQLIIFAEKKYPTIPRPFVIKFLIYLYKDTKNYDKKIAILLNNLLMFCETQNCFQKEY